jgi:hypothetical protein
MIDDCCLILRASRLDHVFISAWIKSALDDYHDCTIPQWIHGGHGYIWDLLLFASTGCLDSELL